MVGMLGWFVLVGVLGMNMKGVKLRRMKDGVDDLGLYSIIDKEKDEDEVRDENEKDNKNYHHPKEKKKVHIHSWVVFVG